MGRPRPRSVHRALAVLGLVAFLFHAALKLRDGLLPELLWGCNLTALALILAFAFEWDRVVGGVFVWRLVFGEPGFLAGLGSGERYVWTTAFVHVVPTALAALYLRRSGLPRGSAAWALMFSVLLVPLGHFGAPAALNVNFGHQRLPWLEAWAQGVWTYRGLSLMLMTLALGLGEWASRRWWFGPAKGG